MTPNSWLQLIVYLVVLLALVKPLGWYIARVYEGQSCGLDRLLGPVERLLYRLAGPHATGDMGWRGYAGAVLVFSALGFVFVYSLQRLQGMLPLNPAGMGAVSADSSFNTSVSFVTNTNWQGYGGEGTMSYFTQMIALTVQNFTSAAVGMSALAVLARGLRRRSEAAANVGAGNQVAVQGLGNFWVDLTRGTLYVLLPLSLLLAVVLVSQGVVQTFGSYVTVPMLQATTDANGQAIKEQTIAVGPAASQIAIKQLGTNGGGFFNVNSAHPFENPTPLSNFLQVLSILLIPAALCYTFGKMVRDTRQGWALLVAMTLILVATLGLTVAAEVGGNPALAGIGASVEVDQQAGAFQPGGNMEGKEARLGTVNSALWATVTTAASNGSVNSMHDSFTPLGGMWPMWLMQLGEIVFGGAGSGLYGMLLFVIVAVFVSGLMVGRTPEYLGKKIEPFEMKMAALAILVPSMFVLVGTALAVMLASGRSSLQDAGPHGFSEMLYAFSSASNNNGSAFAGLSANTPLLNTMLGLCMLAGRFLVLLPVLAIAGSMAAKRTGAVTEGTLPTHTPLFIGMLIATVVTVGALTFVPALALGPIVEHLMLPR